MRDRALAPGVAHWEPGKATAWPGWPQPPPCPGPIPQPEGEGPPLSWPEKSLFAAATFLFHTVKSALTSAQSTLAQARPEV